MGTLTSISLYFDCRNSFTRKGISCPALYFKITSKQYPVFVLHLGGKKWVFRSEIHFLTLLVLFQSYAQPGLQYIQGQQIYTAHPQGVVVQPTTAVTTIVAAGQPQPIQQVRVDALRCEGHGNLCVIFLNLVFLFDFMVVAIVLQGTNCRVGYNTSIL